MKKKGTIKQKKRKKKKEKVKKNVWPIRIIRKAHYIKRGAQLIKEKKSMQIIHKEYMDPKKRKEKKCKKAHRKRKKKRQKCYKTNEGIWYMKSFKTQIFP